MSRGKARDFGEVGLEADGTGGYRHVMFIAGESVIVLNTTVAGDDQSDIYPGRVTYVIQDTEWAIKSDIDLAEKLEIHVKRLDKTPKLLR